MVRMQKKASAQTRIIPILWRRVADDTASSPRLAFRLKNGAAAGARLHSMHSLYNRVAGQSVERLAALSDGIFAVAMTLLVLDLHVPSVEAVHGEQDLWRAL